MTDSPGTDIIVVGGGIGGLALAAGLRRHGFEVTVLDRDTDLRRTGGYHITLDPRAQQALAGLLPPDVFERLLASSADGRLRDPDPFWDHQGRLIGQARTASGVPGIDIDRITLRVLLAEAAGDRLVLGRTFENFRHSENGTVVARFDDGSEREAGLLVGADGVQSRVARQLAGGPTSRPTGLVGVCGRTPRARLSQDEQDRLGTRSSLAVGAHGTALYVGYLDPGAQAVLDAPELSMAVTKEPIYIWGAMFPESKHTGQMRALSESGLRDATRDLLRSRGWGERPLAVLEHTDTQGIAVFRFNAASSDPQEQAPWPAGNVTALGDAVHATPPTAGMGAGVAIRDAAALVQELQAARAGQKALRVAVHDFEGGMRERGAEAIRAAMKTVNWVLATNTPAGAALTRAALPVLAGLHGLKQSSWSSWSG
ncbi:FAD-dependent monooxygenase [Kineosporia rhizophila]|uniref:FAD-dependent oxidoreductase n=1 Tax=Kineosporia rhizophila TaxID=84633 RepID=UPI001E2A8578|nr:NAD(P)/FAD-dependent oxidoreductase [Kineosporia rhizophila]MCE0534638.1 FAD-dependent monooxygenase [Kineosporia rhizophila]